MTTIPYNDKFGYIAVEYSNGKKVPIIKQGTNDAFLTQIDNPTLSIAASNVTCQNNLRFWPRNTMSTIEDSQEETIVMTGCYIAAESCIMYTSSIKGYLDIKTNIGTFRPETTRTYTQVYDNPLGVKIELFKFMNNE